MKKTPGLFLFLTLALGGLLIAACASRNSSSGSALAADDDDDNDDNDDNISDDDDDNIDADLVVDASQIVGQLNRWLNGGHYHDETPDPNQLAIGETFRRRVASSANHMHWDCDTQSFDADTIAEYDDWLDLLQTDGLEPMISLAYVPECLTGWGYPKAPPLPSEAAAYEAYIRSFFHEFVTNRVAAGKKPLQYFEVWNEPDPELPQPTTGGSGFFGTLDEFVDRIFIPLGQAVLAEEAASGAYVNIGVAACAIPHPMSDDFADLQAFLRFAGVQPDTAALLGAAGEAFLNLFYPWGGFAALWNTGGYTWPDRLVKTGAEQGIHVDFVSWHHYIDFPFEGPGPGCDVPNFVWFMHQANPGANAHQYYANAQDYHDRYPNQKAFVTEWGTSYGCESRPAYEVGAFHATSLIAMQQGGLDAAMALYLPGTGPEAIAHWMFAHMADNLARQQLKENSEATGLWTLASIDHANPDRLTLFLAQWRSLAKDVTSRTIKVAVLGMPLGAYQAAVRLVDEQHPGSTTPARVYALAVGADGTMRFDAPLNGNAAAFLDITRH